MSKADEVRALLTSLNSTLEKEGFIIMSAHFVRDEQTNELKNVRLSYEEQKGGQ